MKTDEQLCKFKNIVKKAKQCRSGREKSFNDASSNSLQKRKKPNLSQSFIMRQTVALSAKNKQLVNALTQSKQLNSDFENNMRLMQEKLISVIMKLNSREVALDHCLQKLEAAKKSLQSKEEIYSSLYNQMHVLLSKMPQPSQAGDNNAGAAPTDYTPVHFSIQPKRVPVTKSKRSASISPPKSRKWKPDLSIVQEKYPDDSLLEVLPNIDPAAVINDNNDRTNEGELDSEPTTPSASLLQCSHAEYSSPSNDQMTSILDAEITMRKERRRTSIFSISSFDFGKDDVDDSYNVPDDDHQANIPEENHQKDSCAEDIDDESLFECATKASKINTDELHATSKSAQYRKAELKQNETNNKQALTATKPKKVPKPALKIALKKKRKNFKNTSFGDAAASGPNVDSMIYSDQSMDLTNPTESTIILAKPTKSSKTSKKSKAVKAKSKVKRTEETVEKDVYNCSGDSFLTNPDKRVELSKGKNTVKSRSLPMTNITNDIDLDENNSVKRSRRRTASCMSYKEPSVGKKLRRGDKFFESKLCH